VLDSEMVNFEEPALWLLGRAANGSMRDALSLTDQAVAFGSGKLSEADVRSMLGSVELSFVYRLLDAVVSQDAAQTLAVVEAMSEHAPDFGGTLQELASLLHRVAVAQAVPEAVDNTWGDAEQVLAFAGRMTAEDTQLYYQLAVNGRRDIGLAPEMRSGFEMTLLRMIAFRPVAVLDESLEPGDLVAGGEEVAAPAKKPEPRAAVDAAPPPTAARRGASVSGEAAPEATEPKPPRVAPPPFEVAVSAAEPAPEPVALAAPDHPDSDGGPAERTPFEPARWAELLDKLPLSGMVYSVASHCELRQVDGDKAYLVLDEANGSLYNDTHAGRIASALGEYLGRAVSVHIEIGVPRYETPAARARRLMEERQAQALASIESDPKVQLLLDRFEGTLDTESVTPIKH